MKDLLKKPVTFEKAEFWIATVVFLLSVFILFGQMINADSGASPLEVITTPTPGQTSNGDNLLPQIALYTTFYVWFILVDLVIIQSFVKGRYVILNIILLPVVCVGIALLLTAITTWMPNFSYLIDDMDARVQIFRQKLIFLLWLLIILGFYTFFKQIVKANSKALKTESLGGRQLITECATALFILALLGFFFRMSYLNWRIGVEWCGVLFYGICLYWYLSFTVIPEVRAKNLEQSDFFFKTAFIMVISIPVASLIMYIPLRRINAILYLGVFDAALGLFIVGPLTWLLYKYRNRRYRELQGLKTELGQSSANLDFLRSQINPHFLFNALNTLYGTALQENAERTGEGIQKLGDMMRFMLQENMQEKISLTREVDYLNNYIELQKLRTQISPDIVIQTEIDMEIKGLEIAPMLLIPFVENAFKHGISLRDPSHIKISLQTRDKVLYFDISNSIHPKNLNDPERDKSGIGLENVKQRLNLLYLGEHELSIRKSAKEFFIHLTVTLAG